MSIYNMYNFPLADLATATWWPWKSGQLKQARPQSWSPWRASWRAASPAASSARSTTTRCSTRSPPPPWPGSSSWCWPTKNGWASKTTPCLRQHWTRYSVCELSEGGTAGCRVFELRQCIQIRLPVAQVFVNFAKQQTGGDDDAALRRTGGVRKDVKVSPVKRKIWNGSSMFTAASLLFDHWLSYVWASHQLPSHVPLCHY